MISQSVHNTRAAQEIIEILNKFSSIDREEIIREIGKKFCLYCGNDSEGRCYCRYDD